MRRKYLIQIILLIILVILSISIFNYYEKNSPVKKDRISDENLSNNISLSNQQNLIEDIKYTANNTKGDIYEILATLESCLEDSELMFLTNVRSKIILMNQKENIYLTSNFANFNTKTFETTFIKNVNYKT